MSLPEAHPPTTDEIRSRQDGIGRRGLLAGLLAVAGAGLTGCAGGFSPMYATDTSGGSLDERLAQVQFETIPGRVGQQIRNNLVFEATGGGTPLPPTHRFEVAIRERTTSTLVSRQGDSASQVYNLDASFRLIDLSQQKVVFQGTSYARAGFERYTSIYANVRARRDAEDRAARTIATDLRGRLAAYLARPV